MSRPSPLLLAGKRNYVNPRKKWRRVEGWPGCRVCTSRGITNLQNGLCPVCETAKAQR